jgi:hypothetical protein
MNFDLKLLRHVRCIKVVFLTTQHIDLNAQTWIELKWNWLSTLIFIVHTTYWHSPTFHLPEYRSNIVPDLFLSKLLLYGNMFNDIKQMSDPLVNQVNGIWCQTNWWDQKYFTHLTRNELVKYIDHDSNLP